MSKIKQTDITKLSQLEQQIEQLKEQKKKQEAQRFCCKVEFII